MIGTLEYAGTSPYIVVSTESQPMPQATARTARLEARITPETLATLRRAADLQGRSVSEFVVAAAQEAAIQTIEREQIIRLSMDDQVAFAKAILNPPAPTEAMERAIGTYMRLINSSR